jgi:uncharacterized protein Usg
VVRENRVSQDFAKQDLGYGLTTPEIVYRRPHRHCFLQSCVWRDYDMFQIFQRKGISP